MPGALAAQALTFAQYFASFLPFARSSSAIGGDLNAPPPLSIKVIAFICIAFVTAINCLSASIGGAASKALTTVAMAGCAFVVFLGAYAMLSNDERRHNWHYNMHDEPLGPTNIAGFGPAVISALWAFSGWADIAALAEELKQPVAKNMPKVSGVALLVITVAYVLMNASYMAVVPAERLSSEGALGVTFARLASGRQWPGLLLSAFVCVSTLSSLHNNLFMSARQFYATARDGLFPTFLAKTSNVSQAPLASVLTTSALSALLVCAANFRNLVDYLSFALWLYYGLLGLCVVVLRRKYPNAYRPFKVPMYPALPLLFAGACLYIAANTFAENLKPCMFSLLFVLLAFPVHYARKRYNSSNIAAPPYPSAPGEDASASAPLLVSDGESSIRVNI